PPPLFFLSSSSPSPLLLARAAASPPGRPPSLPLFSPLPPLLPALLRRLPCLGPAWAHGGTQPSGAGLGALWQRRRPREGSPRPTPARGGARPRRLDSGPRRPRERAARGATAPRMAAPCFSPAAPLPPPLLPRRHRSLVLSFHRQRSVPQPPSPSTGVMDPCRLLAEDLARKLDAKHIGSKFQIRDRNRFWATGEVLMNVVHFDLYL
ncbi:unnamed protein product, partial [Urochloa humidicola]